jgi:hypothetical protein
VAEYFTGRGTVDPPLSLRYANAARRPDGTCGVGTVGRIDSVDGELFGVHRIWLNRADGAAGWTRATAGLRKTRYRGVARVGWIFTLTATAYNLLRLPNFLGAAE